MYGASTTFWDMDKRNIVVQPPGTGVEEPRNQLNAGVCQGSCRINLCNFAQSLRTNAGICRCVVMTCTETQPNNARRCGSSSNSPHYSLYQDPISPPRLGLPAPLIRHTCGLSFLSVAETSEAGSLFDNLCGDSARQSNTAPGDSH